MVRILGREADLQWMLRNGNCERKAAITCLQLSEDWKEGGAANVTRTCWLDIANKRRVGA